MVFALLFFVALLFVPQAAKAGENWGYALWGEYTTPSDFSIPGARRTNKVGKATCTNVLGIVKTGDCSIHQAMKDGGISTVSYADWDKKSILFLINTLTLKVYGF